MTRRVILGLNCVICIILNCFGVGGRVLNNRNFVEDEILV